MAGQFKDTWLNNIYAPSGAENKKEREKFFTHDLAYLLPPVQKDIVLAGDFNCVFSPSDCTGSPNISNALSATIKELALHDAWESPSQLPHYTQYTKSGATRIDRIYLFTPLKIRKQGIGTLIAPFSDHLAVVLRLTYHH